MSLFGFLGSLVGAGASMFGASQAQSGARAAARMNMKATKWAGRKNLEWQRKFARKGIRWRVKDAKRAGLHPLAALGAQVTPFSPSFQVGNAGEIMASGSSAAAGLYSQAGQDIGRAVSALGDTDQRNDAFMQRVQELQLQNLELQNAAIASNIAMQNQAGNPPPMVSRSTSYLVDGQGQTVRPTAAVAGVSDQPLQRTGYTGTQHEPAPIADVGYINAGSNENGIKLAPVMSADAKQRLEEDFIGSLQHWGRTRLYEPMMNVMKAAPTHLLKPRPGEMIVFNPFTGVYSIEKDPGYGKTKGFPDDAFKY